MANQPPIVPTISNYRLVKRIGRGAFGEVWLAVEVLTRIYRAIKIISGGKAARRVELEGVREYQQRSRGHPNLIQVLTVGEADGCLYYVMEAADDALGSHLASPEDYEPLTLATVLAREGRLSITDALDHAASMLAAVDHLNRGGFHHHDLKPSNILFAGGALKLADVGLGSRNPERAAGTPEYQTPEGTSDDLYAVGITLYEMVTGQPASRFPELPVDLTGRYDRRLPRVLHRVINKACHPDATERFATATEFQEALQAVMAAPALRTKRGRVIMLIASVAILATLLFTIVWASSIPEWKDLEFALNEEYKEKTIFPYSDTGSITFSFERVAVGREAQIQITGTLDILFPDNPDALIALFLAVDDEIVHIIYYHVPSPACGNFELDVRPFPLRNTLLRKFRTGRCPVYLVFAATGDIFAYLDEYKAAPEKSKRVLIGHIQNIFEYGIGNP